MLNYLSSGYYSFGYRYNMMPIEVTPFKNIHLYFIFFKYKKIKILIINKMI